MSCDYEGNIKKEAKNKNSVEKCEKVSKPFKQKVFLWKIDL